MLRGCLQKIREDRQSRILVFVFSIPSDISRLGKRKYISIMCVTNAFRAPIMRIRSLQK